MDDHWCPGYFRARAGAAPLKLIIPTLRASRVFDIARGLRGRGSVEVVVFSVITFILYCHFRPRAGGLRLKYILYGLVGSLGIISAARAGRLRCSPLHDGSTRGHGPKISAPARARAPLKCVLDYLPILDPSHISAPARAGGSVEVKGMGMPVSGGDADFRAPRGGGSR